MHTLQAGGKHRHEPAADRTVGGLGGHRKSLVCSMPYVYKWTGESNVVADALSRIGESESITEISYENFAKYQQIDDQLQKMLKDKKEDSKYKLNGLSLDKNNLMFESSTGRNRLYVPLSLRNQHFTACTICLIQAFVPHGNSYQKGFSGPQ